MTSFDGKVVLVTGGSSGIGRAAVRAFAEAGARVVLAARRVKPGEELASDIRDRGGLAHFVAADGAPGGALYSAKAGVLARTKSAAQESAGSGIRVNALVAGAFRTPCWST